MKSSTEYTKARDMLLDIAVPVEKERVKLHRCTGRILAMDLIAKDNVPAFDRSPLDGYAIKAEDTIGASRDNPVTLNILEEVPAGYLPTMPVTSGTATKILTGSPIPDGANAVIMYERTEFTSEQITIFNEVKPSENVIYAGEDVKKGTLLASCGTRIDDGLEASLSAQNEMEPLVYGKPRISIISTGTELLEEDEYLAPGKIRNTSRYALTNALERLGCDVTYLGTAKDKTEQIASLIEKGLIESDMVILTGGVSVGDYDLTPKAMEMAGVDIRVRGVGLKPGMACALGAKNGKLVCALSGNPSSSVAVYFAVVQPCVRKLAGLNNPVPEMFDIILENGFNKPSKATRILRGKLKFEGGQVKMFVTKGQGNVTVSGTIGTNVAAIVPAGSGPVEPGTVLKAFLL